MAALHYTGAMESVGNQNLFVGRQKLLLCSQRLHRFFGGPKELSMHLRAPQTVHSS